MPGIAGVQATAPIVIEMYFVVIKYPTRDRKKDCYFQHIDVRTPHSAPMRRIHRGRRHPPGIDMFAAGDAILTGRDAVRDTSPPGTLVRRVGPGLRCGRNLWPRGAPAHQ